MLLPARKLLTLSDIVKPAWAKFDAIWYLRTYQQAHNDCDGDPAAALRYYFESGVKLGHSPSPLFDETFYLQENPDISRLVEQESYDSGFDHFCQSGHRMLSPHWLFNDQLYGRLYEDMSLENLDLHGCFGRYDHYLKSGQFERRQAHFLFDPMFYRNLAIKAGVPIAVIDAEGPFVHYLYSLSNRSIELSPSIYFDSDWYLNAAIGIRSAIKKRYFNSAIEHYLLNKSPHLFDPVPEFSESYYCETNRDVSHAIDQGEFRFGYQHFVHFGVFELRRPHPNVDLVYYRDMNARVNDDINRGSVRDVFAHLRSIGVQEKLVFFPPRSIATISEQNAKMLFVSKAEDNLLLLARQKLNFRFEKPVISVVMVAFDKFALTMLALTSLRSNYFGQMQIILIDNGSSDETKSIEKYLDGVIIIHLKENIGFTRAANIGLQHASAPVMLYLNNDTELGFSAINSALKRLSLSEKIGAVGGKIIRSHGKLQEAGSIIWKDGTATGYLRDAPPSLPEANFVREVDYCSAVFLACRTNVLKSIDGFDEDYRPAYYEDADLCIRMLKAGYKTLYDPTIVVHHLEFGSADHSDASKALMRRGHRIFAAKHNDFLKKKLTKLPKDIVKARSNSTKKKVLFIEDTIPLRRLGSGFVRANDIVRAISGAGFDVSIFPLNGALRDISTVLADFPDQVEVLNDRDFTVMRQFIFERSDFYDLIWVSRTHNLKRILPLCLEAGVNPEITPFVLDTEAIVSFREATRSLALSEDQGIDIQEKSIEEFSGAHQCASILAGSNSEVDWLRRLGLPHVSLLGTARQPEPTANNFSEREGLLFVGSIHQVDSPNLDSLYWFRDEIYHWLTEEMENLPVLNFVGYVADSVDLSDFNGDPRITIHGCTDDLFNYYNTNRVFIAPTRFAAGTPYKIYEAASFGLPCVTTDLLAGQLGWNAGLEILAAPVKDPRRFASQIAILYRTERLWTKLRTQAIKRLDAENRPEDFNKSVRKILKVALDRTPSKLDSTTISKGRTARKSVPVR